MLVGLDDTDSLQGGCTTHLLLRLLAAAPGLALQGPPRLVRLNPNVARKTRGNGAVAFRLVRPAGPSTVVGAWEGRPILAYPNGDPVAATDIDPLVDRLWDAVERFAEPDAGSGLVAWGAAAGPDPATYWRTVREEVRDAPVAGRSERARGHGWGLVGARAAVAWPGATSPSSHELIAYREPGRVGTPRAVRPDLLAALDGGMGGAGATFHTFDPEEGRLTCVPHTPCPVLAGLRGRDPAVLVERGLPALRSACEPFTSWLLWATNQGSGDHVTPVPSLAAARPSTTAQLRATVVGQPGRRAGGHLFVACADADGTRFEAAAFEPTKQFRDVVGRLRPGDEAELVGPVEGGVLRLEKLRVVSLAATRTKVANPACPSCGKAMKSAGAGAGYRCRGCGTSAGDEAATWLAEARTLSLGWHEVPVAARRHLHRPLAWEGRERGGEGGDGGGEGLSPPSAVASACASPSSR